MIPAHPIVDSHCHLTSAALADQVEDVVSRAASAGVGELITVSTDVADAERCIALADRFSGVYATAGIHPHEAAKASSEDRERLGRLLSHPAVVALGEIGLDYYYDFSDRASQQSVFAWQLELAGAFNHPIVIHCRDAHDDAVAALAAHGFKGKPVVFHCFTGTARQAEVIAQNGWRISFTGIVTFKNSTELQDIARTYPLDNLMLETDSPYLSPVPVRNVKPNEPAHVVHIARFLAQLRGCPLETLAAQTTANARSFFRLDRAKKGLS